MKVWEAIEMLEGMNENAEVTLTLGAKRVKRPVRNGPDFGNEVGECIQYPNRAIPWPINDRYTLKVH